MTFRPRVVLGAIVALGPGRLVSLSIWRRRPWDALVASQLWSYEKPDGPGDLNTIIRSEDFERASKALRRAKLNPCGCTHMPTSPPGAEDSRHEVDRRRPARWHPPDAPEIYLQVKTASARRKSGRGSPEKTSTPDWAGRTIARPKRDLP